MPTGNCRFPEHHSPSARPVFAWVAALALGALIITHLHTAELVLIVLGILAALAVPVFLLWHNHGSAIDPALEAAAAVRHRRAQQLAAEYEAQQLAASQQPAIEAPVVHNHLHLHGVSADDMAAAVRHAIEAPQSQPYR